MKKIVILMPVYNDWESLIKLLKEINLVIQEIKNYSFSGIIINDFSTDNKPNIIKPQNLKSLKIIDMKKNQGHAKCNASGLRYMNSHEEYDYVILMDSDGEDRPPEIKELINKISDNPNNSVVAKRVKRSEGLLFQTLYQLHKLLTIIFTGKNVNFGNYSCLTKKDVNVISEKASIWSSFSGTLKKNISNLKEINSIRGIRYFGPSKMSLFNLAIHSLSIIGVFKYNVFFRSCVFIILLSFLTKYSFVLVTSLQLIIVIFNLLIFFISRRENLTELLNSSQNILKISDLH